MFVIFAAILTVKACTLLSAHLILNDENTDERNLYVRLEVMQCALHLPFCRDLVAFQQYCPSGAPCLAFLY